MSAQSIGDGRSRQAAKLREPHKVLFYVQDLARDFQSYYTRLKTENDPILPQESQRAEAGWDKLYRVNLLHVFKACHAVLPTGCNAASWTPSRMSLWSPIASRVSSSGSSSAGSRSPDTTFSR